MLSRDQVIKQINQFEFEYPVNQWEVEGVKIWPYIRIKLGLMYYYSSDVKKVSYNTSESKTERPNKYFELIRSYTSWLKLFFFNCDYFFVGNFHYRSKVNNKWVNRFFDILVVLLKQDSYKSLVLEVSRNEKAKYFNKNRLFFEDRLKPATYHWPLKRNGIQGATKLTGYDHFVQTIKQDPIIRKVKWLLSEDELKKQLEKVIWEANFFYSILSIKRPKYVCMLNYYSTSGLGLSIAAAKLEIPSVDIQHGGQGPFHMAYGNWKKAPDGGYEMLPKYFWSWGNFEADSINAWALKTNYHKAIVIGNPWIDSFKNPNIVKQVLKLEPNNILGNDKKPVILISLQSKEIELPKILLELIRLTKDQYFWGIRVHPTHILSIDMVKKELDSLGVSGCYEINTTSELPLPILLGKTSVHITEFSGVTKEASRFGIFTIMLHPYSAEMFEEEVQLKNAVYFKEKNIETLHDLIKSKIDNNKKRGRGNTSPFFYEKFIGAFK